MWSDRHRQSHEDLQHTQVVTGRQTLQYTEVVFTVHTGNLTQVDLLYPHVVRQTQVVTLGLTSQYTLALPGRQTSQ